MIKNILFTRVIPNITISMLKEKGYEVDVNEKDQVLTQPELINLLKQKPYDGVVTLLTDKIDKKVFDATPSTKIFANYASGFDNIDIVLAKERGVTVTNAPTDLTSISVAEHAVAFMFALAKRLVEADKFVREGKYDGWAPMKFLGNSLSGKTIGIVGTGRIGEKVASLCKGLGLKIIYTNNSKNENIERETGATYCNSLDELLREADFVSLHVPLLPSTTHLINETNLNLMKPTSFLINTSRGAVIDEVALEKALRGKVIAGAGLDVFEFEPKVTPGLTSLSNVILTPHIASANLDAREAMGRVVAENLIDFFEGRVPKDIVSK